MPARQTEHDSYGGGRRWQEGAGESWTSVRGGGARQWGGWQNVPANTGQIEPAHPDESNQVADDFHLRTHGPKDYRRSDERILDDVCERLTHDRHIDSRDVSVEVKHGVITLDGTVPHRPMKHRIEDIAASCRGVHDVENRIRVHRLP